MPTTTFRVAAIAKLQQMPGNYLYVARAVNPQVVRYLRRTQAGVAEYEQLRHRRTGLKLAHALMYLMISLTSVLAAIWVGLWFAGRLVAPIRRLIAAAQEVSRGHLDVQLPILRGEGDLRRLSSTFNTMTMELRRQQDALLSANSQLDERRRFMEAVLSGVSAGVIGLDAAGRVTLANKSALKLLSRSETDLVGRSLSELVPELAPLLDAAAEPTLRGRPQQPVKLTVAGEDRTFAVRITVEAASGQERGSVVTFDDITELVAAQRTSAWADVARRIAHEIKNPLTPIQLSAERIRRKYGKVVQEDRETFEKLTDTIIRQVGDIKSMVDEFASFARMPKPQMEAHDLRQAVQEPVILFRESHPNIDFELKLPPEPLVISGDRRLLSQAITNLVKNASEAIQAAGDAPDRPADYRGRIEVRVERMPDRIDVVVIDNGIGLPKQNRARLLEPYVTTRAKGTGLGLAIVQKVVEQHGGTLALEDAPAAPGRVRGALIRVSLPLRTEPSAPQPKPEFAEATAASSQP
jgi:two-component system nitrogen regulation sensor histidine kinase NtrY